MFRMTLFTQLSRDIKTPIIISVFSDVFINNCEVNFSWKSRFFIIKDYRETFLTVSRLKKHDCRYYTLCLVFIVTLSLVFS